MNQMPPNMYPHPSYNYYYGMQPYQQGMPPMGMNPQSMGSNQPHESQNYGMNYKK
jgi:hypothetical protein